MNDTIKQVKIRPMVFSDLGAIAAIDQEVRASGIPVSYSDATAHKLFGIDAEKADPTKKPDILEVAKLVDLGFVAEVAGIVRGFILGRQVYIAESDTQQGSIALIGVSPHYERRGIAMKLVNALCELFHSRDILRISMSVDPTDHSALAFVERAGFHGTRLLHFSKKCASQ
ncbi:GNAT family N-acetyltransferase [Chloroflexota bacterium]